MATPRTTFGKMQVGSFLGGAITVAVLCGAYAAQAEGATFSSGMYLHQEGLIAQWDGIDNVGTGTHNPDAKTWKDLVGTRDLALVSGKAAFADGNALECLSRSAGYAAGPAAVCPGYKTIEIVCTQKTGSSIAVIVSAGSGPRAILSEGAFAGTRCARQVGGTDDERGVGAAERERGRCGAPCI